VEGRIVIDPKVLRGVRLLLRVLVFLFIWFWSCWLLVWVWRIFWRSFSELREEDIRAALEFASKLLKNGVVLSLEVENG